MSSSYLAAKAPADSNTCFWCSNPLNSQNIEKDCVCQTCYKLLLNAGISEDEIFKQDKEEYKKEEYKEKKSDR